jgi:hypothetical protein
MGIAETITAITALVAAGTALWREIRGVKKMGRADIIDKAERIAWQAVETTKRIKPGMTSEEIWREFQKEVLKYLSGKGLGKISPKEWEGMRQTAEVLSHGAKSAFKGLQDILDRDKTPPARPPLMK